MKEHSDPLQLLEDCKRVTDRLVTALLQAADVPSGQWRADHKPTIPKIGRSICFH